MSNQWGDLTNKIRKLASREIGVSLREVGDELDRPLNVASGFVTKMVRHYKELHKAGVHGEYRYFANPDHAKAHDVEAQAQKLIRMEESKKRRKEYEAKRERAKRAKAREEKGLPPYDPTAPKKPKKVSLKPRYSGLVLATKEKQLENKKTHLKATITWPDHVKVQVIPRGEDTRFKFTPEPGWRGQITQDWYDRRMAV